MFTDQYLQNGQEVNAISTKSTAISVIHSRIAAMRSIITPKSAVIKIRSLNMRHSMR